MLQPDRPTDDNKIRRMRFACWITKATDTHSEYVILIALTRQQWLRECDSMLLKDLRTFRITAVRTGAPDNTMLICVREALKQKTLFGETVWEDCLTNFTLKKAVLPPTLP
jgi:hypothetical protein